MKRLRFVPIIFAAVAGLALVAGCGSGKQSVPTNAVAIVGGETITKGQFDQLLQQAWKGYDDRKELRPKAGSPEYNALRAQAMQFLVQREEFEQKAADLDIEVTDEDVEKRLKEIKQQYFKGNEKKYREQLKKQGLGEDQVRADIRAQLIQEKIYNKVTEGVTVSKADIEDHYKKNREQYVQPATRDVRHILVKKKALADQLYQQITGGASLAQLAKKHSQDTFSKKMGGKLTISKGQTAPPFEKVAFAAAVDSISKPVKTQFGWHIIQPIAAAKKESVTPLKQVRDSIRQQLVQSKKQEKMTEWVNDTRKEFDSKTTYQIGFAPPETDSTQSVPTPQQ